MITTSNVPHFSRKKLQKLQSFNNPKEEGACIGALFRTPLKLINNRNNALDIQNVKFYKTREIILSISDKKRLSMIKTQLLHHRKNLLKFLQSYRISKNVCYLKKCTVQESSRSINSSEVKLVAINCILL